MTRPSSCKVLVIECMNVGASVCVCEFVFAKKEERGGGVYL